jgi:hypothetical protein
MNVTCSKDMKFGLIMLIIQDTNASKLVAAPLCMFVLIKELNQYRVTNQNKLIKKSRTSHGFL